MRAPGLWLLLFVAACSHHPPGGGACDPMDPACGMPGNPIVIGCAGCPDFPPGDQHPPACTGQGVDPQLVYPPDQVLLPPNMNVIEVQFLPGTGNAIFEVDFSNAATDVRLETRCNAITNTR